MAVPGLDPGIDPAIHKNTVIPRLEIENKGLFGSVNRWRRRTARMAGTRPAMTAEAGLSTAIAIRAKFAIGSQLCARRR
jgi:hypothetical protein